MSDADAVIALEDVWVRYARFDALRGVSLSIPSGAMGLVGRNGAGKSTLMRVLLGLVKPSQGSGRVLGIDLEEPGDRLRRAVGYMPENDALITGMWGVEMVALAGELCGLDRREAIRRAHEVLAYVDLGEARYRPAEQYSTGMRQRLKLAVALVHDPRLLLLDEPTVGLDPPARKRMLDLIDDLCRRHQKSLVISTHLLGDIEHACDGVTILEGGRVLAVGRLDEVLGKDGQHYRLRWHGRGDRFIDTVTEWGGVIVENAPDGTSAGSGRAAARGGDLRVAMPPNFDPKRFFQLAHETKIALVTMEIDHGDLTDSYHRLLSGGAR